MVRSTPIPKPIPDRSCFATDLPHQAVIAATAADAGLGAETAMDELERGLGVVVQAPDQARIDLVRHAETVSDARGQYRSVRIMPRR